MRDLNLAAGNHDPNVLFDFLAEDESRGVYVDEESGVIKIDPSKYTRYFL